MITHPTITHSLRGSYKTDSFALQGFMENHVVFRVVFHKKDGTLRSLLGTIHPGLIPPEMLPNGEGHPNYDEAIPVFDLEKQEWRAFKPSNVVDIYSV